MSYKHGTPFVKLATWQQTLTDGVTLKGLSREKSLFDFFMHSSRVCQWDCGCCALKCGNSFKNS